METVFPDTHYSGMHGSNNRFAVRLSLLLCDLGRALLTPLNLHTPDPPQRVEQLQGVGWVGVPFPGAQRTLCPASRAWVGVGVLKRDVVGTGMGLEK